MADSPPDNTSLKEQQSERAREIVRDLRALVGHPGWKYLCFYLEQKRLNLLQIEIVEASGLDELIRVNGKLREAAVLHALPLMPEYLMTELSNQVEVTDDDD